MSGLAAAFARVCGNVEQLGAAPTPRPPSPVETLGEAFGLGDFERDVLTLAAAVEVEPACARAVSLALADPRSCHPTIGLAIAALPDGHWGAFAPDAPLRRWRLVDVQLGPTFATSALRIDETILHHLLGVAIVDPRIATITTVLGPGLLAPAQHLAADALEVSASHVCILAGSVGTARAFAVAAAVRASPAAPAPVVEVHPDRLPVSPSERAAMLLLLDREGRRRGLWWFVDGSGDPHEAAQLTAGLSGPVFYAAARPPADLARPSYVLPLPPLTGEEQTALWEAELGPRDDLSALATQFQLDAARIRDASAEVRLTGGSVWDACRRRLRPALDDLALVVQPAATWDDLVLPDTTMRLLREMADQAVHRHIVHQQWGFGSARGLGIHALFAGPSGTGKSLAAEVLASALRLDLVRIDLSRVVSKYIGDTEKNLRRVFDAADDGAAVLLFDEADALFGKRTEARDAHDRYANIEVSYLLQRMESYRGVAILTTNHRAAMDTAFLRRLRFVVRFPHPEPSQRAQIWRRSFPAPTPLLDVDMERLARLDVAGGHIRNMALHAAFLAASEGGAVRMRHIARAAEVEYAKLDRVLSPSDTRGWV